MPDAGIRPVAAFRSGGGGDDPREEGAGLGHRLDRQFAAQEPLAGAVLPKRIGGLVGEEVEVHQVAMGIFAQVVAGEDAPGAIDRTIVFSSSRMIGEQPTERLEISTAEALALDQAPILVTVDEQVRRIARHGLT